MTFDPKPTDLGLCWCCRGGFPYSQLTFTDVYSTRGPHRETLCDACLGLGCWRQWGLDGKYQSRCGRRYNRRSGTWTKERVVPLPKPRMWGLHERTKAPIRATYRVRLQAQRGRCA